MPSLQAEIRCFRGISERQVGELLINSGNRLLQHPAMLGCRGTAEVGNGPCPVQFKRSAPLSQDALFWCERRLCHAFARGLFLLRLD